MWRIFAAFLAGLMMFASQASARLTSPAKVRYQTQEGMSRWQETDVSFLTGEELNDITRSFQFQAFKSYATIFFGRTSSGKAQIAVILIDDPMIFCSGRFDPNCLPIMGKMRGKDSDGRGWEICTAMYC